MRTGVKVGLGLAVAVLSVPVWWLLMYCNHKFSRPFSCRKNGKKETYVVCFKCSRDYEYDMKTLRVGAERKRT